MVYSFRPSPFFVDVIEVDRKKMKGKSLRYDLIGESTQSPRQLGKKRRILAKIALILVAVVFF